MTSPLDYVTVREYNQLVARIDEQSQRIHRLEDERVTLAVISEQLNSIRTEFAGHEQAHATREQQLRSDVRSMLVKIGSAVGIGILGEILQLLHNYVFH